MYAKILLTVLFVVFSVVLHAQDTVRIKRMKEYVEGKINLLVLKPGKEVQVNVLPTAGEWPEDEGEEEAVEGMLEAAKMSYLDPALTPAAKEAIQANKCINAKFAGLSRAKVKTSIADDHSYSVTSVPSLINSLPNDKDMTGIVNALSKPWRERSVQEDKEITITNAYLIAYKREADNDYHLIITNATQTKFFNVEISALPHFNSKSYQTLKTVRGKFEDRFARACGNYIIFNSPVPIAKLKGSLFFDTDHPVGPGGNGVVGPQGKRPKTAWEIHPVTFIQMD